MKKRKMLISLTLTLLLLSCAYANSSSVEINGVEFEIPSKYQGGEIVSGNYRLENFFSISCIDEDISNSIGLWAMEKEFSEDKNINDHPVRHYCSYNKYVDGNLSHAYFPSGQSVYEIKWAGTEITPDIEKLINNTPQSEIDEETFYNILDESVDIYKSDKIDRLSHDAEYNYLEAKSPSDYQHSDDRELNKILLTYYNRK